MRHGNIPACFFKSAVVARLLFNTGVGYFQREGQLDGNARIELSFAASDMNDLLKSLILQDQGGGKVSTVNYDSHDPVEKTLRSFAIDLSSNPSFGQVLNQGSFPFRSRRFSPAVSSLRPRRGLPPPRQTAPRPRPALRPAARA